MTTLTMPSRVGDFLLSEAPGTLSRDAVVVISGAGNLVSGTVLGQITNGSCTASAISGTGNATCSAVTVAAGATVGAHKLIAIAETKLELFNPSGAYIGQVTTGVAASLGGLGFTITAGVTAMVAGDSFTLTVAAGSGKYSTYDDDNTDGTDTAVAVLYTPVDATSADQYAVVISRMAEVDSNKLTWAATNDNTDKTNGLADLAARYIFARS